MGQSKSASTAALEQIKDEIGPNISIGDVGDDPYALLIEGKVFCERIQAIGAELNACLKATEIRRLTPPRLSPSRSRISSRCTFMDGYDGNRRHGKPCFRCGTKIKKNDMVGRTVYRGPSCQKS